MVEQKLDKTQILDQFLSSGEQLVAAVKDLPEAALDYSTAPGEWTIRQIVHHVSDDADLFSFGLKKAIAKPGSALRFEDFPGHECWFTALNFACRPIGPVLDLNSGPPPGNGRYRRLCWGRLGRFKYRNV